jgi:hypothetical protein
MAADCISRRTHLAERLAFTLNTVYRTVSDYPKAYPLYTSKKPTLATNFNA